MIKEKITDQELMELFEQFLNNLETMSKETFGSDVIAEGAEKILHHKNESGG